MRRFLLLLLLFLPCQALGGDLRLSPSVIDNGGVALLSWSGEIPSSATVRFNGGLCHLRPTPEGAMALLGADVELAPATYPVEVEIAREGAVEVFLLPLEVRRAIRPEERLTLPPEKVTPRDPAVLKRIEKENALLAQLFSSETSPLWETFGRPVDDPVGSIFGLRRILNGQSKSPHSGVDFRSPAGRPVRSAASGNVVFAGDLFYTGQTVILDHGEGLFTLYAHLRSIDCSMNQLLTAGEILGRVGSTGRSTGPHLHWGVKLRGARVDPLALVELLSGEKR